jgi:L-threonine kinase
MEADLRIRGAVQTLRCGEGFAHGTFGELLQGALRSDYHFLVTCPIEGGTVATFTAIEQRDGVEVEPPGKWKSRELAQRLLWSLGLPPGGRLRLESQLPEGKGLASSSADLVATARAIAACWGVRLDPGLVEALLREIEPSDGVMYDGPVVFDHRRVRLRWRLGSLPAITIVAIDEGGEFDTLSYETRRPRYPAELCDEYGRLLDRLAQALRAADLDSVGEVSTHSAVLNQRFVPKMALEPILAIAAEVEALGVVATHSGTCVGVMLGSSDPLYDRKLDGARSMIERLTGEVLVCCSAENGGCPS